MSTNANVLKLNADGTLDCAVDWMDGDLDFTGQRLIREYRDPYNVARLIANGSFSEVIPPDELAKTLSGSHDKSLHFKSWRDYATSGEPREYDYVYAHGTWYVAGDHQTMDVKHWTQHVAKPHDWVSVASLIACKRAVVKRTRADFKVHGGYALLKLYNRVATLINNSPITNQLNHYIKTAVNGYQDRFLMTGDEYVAGGSLDRAFDDYSVNHSAYKFLSAIRPVTDRYYQKISHRN